MAGKKLYAVNYNLKIVDIFEKNVADLAVGRCIK